MLYTCDACGEKIVENSPTAPHNYQKKHTSKWWLQWLIERLMNIFFGYEGSEPYYYQCMDCGHIQTMHESSSDSGASAMGTCNHNPGEWTVIYAVSCEGAGIEGQSCTLCDKLLSVRVYAEATGHDIVQHVAKAPTCTDIGWNAYEMCSRCDYSTYSEFSALGHDLTNHDAKEPTCTEIGWNAYEMCSRCDYSTYSEFSTLGHDLTNHVAKTPTCTEIGWNAYETCLRCNHSTYAELPATGHNYIHTVVLPTTQSEGYTEHTCNACGDSYKDNFVEKLTYIVGDTDGSEEINKDDAIFLLMHTFFPEEYPLDQVCDFDQNGSVDKDDAIYLLMYTFFPDEYPLTAQNSVAYAALPVTKRDENE